MSDCIFCKIVAGQIPSKKVYEDDSMLAFHDINPVAPVHFMIIPKAHIESLMHCEASHQDILGKIMLLAPKLAQEQGLPDGFRLLVNTGRGGHQEVPHLHVHVIGGSDKVPRMTETLRKL
jgi:histidine triad (HIT) family protein